MISFSQLTSNVYDNIETKETDRLYFTTDTNKIYLNNYEYGGSTLTFDTEPTQNSTNPVTSGGIYTYITSNYLPLTGGAMTGNINMQNRAVINASGLQAGNAESAYSAITPANIVSTSGSGVQTVISPNNVLVMTGEHQTTITGQGINIESVTTPLISVDKIQNKTMDKIVTVDGSFKATTLYEDDAALSDKYALKTALDAKLNTTGGALTGALTTNRTTFADNELVTKQYVDDNAGGGGTNAVEEAIKYVAEGPIPTESGTATDSSVRIAVYNQYLPYNYIKILDTNNTEVTDNTEGYWVVFSGTLSNDTNDGGLSICHEEGHALGYETHMRYVGETLTEKVFYVPRGYYFAYNSAATNVSIKVTRDI